MAALVELEIKFEKKIKQSPYNMELGQPAGPRVKKKTKTNTIKKKVKGA